jgi:hypothetical protein
MMRAVGFDPLLGIWHESELAKEVDACMKQRGFRYFMSASKADSRAGFLSVESASSEGYGITAAFVQHAPTAATAQARYVQGLSSSDQTAYQTALFGPGDGSGCLPTAQHRLYHASVDGAIPSVLESAIKDIESDAMVSPSVVAAEHDWSSCMESSGYRVPTREAAQQSMRDSLTKITGETGDGVYQVTLTPAMTASITQLSVKERAIATADARCDVRVRLFETLADAYAKAEAAFLTSHPGFSVK